MKHIETEVAPIPPFSNFIFLKDDMGGIKLGRLNSIGFNNRNQLISLISLLLLYLKNRTKKSGRSSTTLNT